MGDEEKYKHVTVVAKERKLFQKKELDFVHRARSLNKPFCTSCFKFDYDNNSLRDFSEYTKIHKFYKWKIANFFKENLPDCIDICWLMFNKSGKHYKQDIKNLIWDALYPEH